MTPRTLLAVALALGLLGRAWGAFDDGIYWPDEIYQSFEPAHFLVFGAGLMPWEYLEGARTWALPGLVAAVLKLCAALGVDSPPAYIRVVKLLFAFLGTLTALGVYRLSRAFKASEMAASAAAALTSLAAVMIYFAPRGMSENACVAPLVWGLALALEDDTASWKKSAWGGSLMGLAVLLRLQCAVVAVAVVLALLLKRRWRATGMMLTVLSVWAVIYGALDAATWHHVPDAKFGGWFHSVFVYVRFNLIEGRGAHWGTSTWEYYFRYLFTSMPTVALVLGAGLFGALLRRRWELPFFAVAFLLIHVASPHKELRFLVPVIPLLAACVALALTGLKPGLEARGAIIVGTLGLVSFVHFPSLTMPELGAYLERPAPTPAWGDYGNVNRLLLVASQRPDLCGLRVDGPDMAWVGGYTYLHRKVPLYRPFVPPQSGTFNYLIGNPGYGAPLVAIAEDLGSVLYRLPIDTCRPDPDFAWQLERSR